MSQRFIVALNDGTPEQNDAITLYLQSKGWHVWHWFGDIWLLAGVPDDVHAWMIDEELKRLHPMRGARYLVIKIEGEAHFSGWLNKDAWPWLEEFWGKVDPNPKYKLRFTVTADRAD